MKKNFNFTLVLGGVLVALVLWYGLYEKKYKITLKEAKEDTKRLISLDRKEIQEFILEKQPVSKDAGEDTSEKKAATTAAPVTYETFEFKKSGEDWYLTAPIKELADASMVASAISAASGAKYERELDGEAKDLSIYGLDKPRFKVRVRKDSNAPYEELIIGSDTPVGFDLYAMGSKDKKVYLASRSVKSAFDRPLKDFRNKKLVLVASNEIPQLEVSVPGESFILKKKEGDTWELSRDNLPASKSEVQKSLSALVGMRAKDFTDEPKNLSAFGLSQPIARIQLKEKGQKDAVEISLGRIKDKGYAKRSDKKTVFEVDPSSLQVLERNSADYQDRNLADFNRFNVTQLKVLRGKDSLDLVKEGDNWILSQKKDLPLDKTKVEALIAKIQDTKIVQYAKAGNETGLKNPQLELVLSDKDGKALAHLKFGQQAGARVYGERAGLDRAFLIALTDFKNLNVTQASLLKTPEKKAEKKTETDQGGKAGDKG